MLPAVVVIGVGAVELPTPPVAAVYHFKLVPVAVNALAVAFIQYETGVDTEGVVGIVLPVVTVEPDNQFEVAPVNAKPDKVPLFALAVASVKEVTDVLVAASIP